MFSLNPNEIYWILTGTVAVAAFLVCIWYLDPLLAWLWRVFVPAVDETYNPGSKERSRSFFLGASDQKAVQVNLLRHSILIRIEDDLDNVYDSDAEAKSWETLIRDIYHPQAYGVTAYLHKRAEIAKALASAQIRAGEAEQATAAANERARRYVAELGEKDVRKLALDEAINERKVADAKITELEQRNQRQFEFITELKKGIEAKDTEIAEMNRRNKNQSDLITSQKVRIDELAAEVFDMKDDRLKLSELLLSMGQRIVKQAELLAKSAEKKPTQGG